MNLRSARKLFARSPATHRPMARWLWNDHLDPDRLVVQLDRILDMGLGGALIRPGKGLPAGTYLSDAWFEAMHAVVRRARKRHASIWIAEDFDDPWTQEIVRGITAETPKFAASALRMRRITGRELREGRAIDWTDETNPFVQDRPQPTNTEIIRAFRIVGNRTFQFYRYPTEEPSHIELFPVGELNSAPANAVFLLFRRESWPWRISGFRTEATLKFLENSHLRYSERLKRYFGNTVGMCSILGVDTPFVHSAIPWDDELPHLFSETYGYDIWNELPSLFFDLGGREHIRYDFWSMIGDMLDEGFATPFERWCDEREIPGALGFESNNSLTHSVSRGGSRMWLTAGLAFNVVTPPEIGEDDLDHQERYEQLLIETRQARSLRRQLDRAGAIQMEHPALIESGLTGATLQPTDIYGMGVEFFEGPSVLFSMKGGRKKTIGAPVLWESASSAGLSSVVDRAARLMWVLSHLVADVEVLMLLPMSSQQATFRPFSRFSSYGEMGSEGVVLRYSQISQALADAHIDFDFGDEQILARHGSVEGRDFRVGRARYSVLVVPPSVNLRASTLGLLQDFAMVGGHVLAVGTVPELIDGRPSDQVKRFFAEYSERIVQGVDFGDYRALADRLVQLGARTVAALGVGGETRPAVYVRRGRWESVEVVSAINGGWDDERVTMEWVPEVTGIVELWDPITGRTEPIATCEAGVTARVPLELAAGAAKLLVVAPGDPESAEIDSRPWVEIGRLTPEWFGKRMRSNACVLSECRAAGGTGQWSNVEGVRETLASSIDAAKGSVPFSTEWRFFVESGPVSRDGWSVAVEFGGSGSIKLDGRPISLEEAEPLFDPAILQVRVPALRSGEHILSVNRSYAEPDDLQPLWVLGPFKLVKNQDGGAAIIATDDSVPLGAWSEVGLPSYFGEVVYRAEVEGAALAKDERAVLEIERVGHCAEVRVNGKLAGTIFARPFECDVSDHWGPGTKTVDVVVTEAPDNALAGLRGVDEFDTTHAGLIGKPEIAIYGRGGAGQ